MKHMPPPPPPAHPGYYRDANGALRWWDGQLWTAVATEVATGEPGLPQPQQPPQPAKKNHTGALIAGLVILGLVVFVSCVASLAGLGSAPEASPSSVITTDEPDPTEDEPEPAEPKIKTYKIGQPATDEDYQFRVTKIKCGVSRVGDQYLNEKAQGQFCLVSMKIKNVGNGAINFSTENQSLIDTKGNAHSPDDAAWLYLDESAAYREINPGNTLSTVVPFDIPKKAKPDYLLLKAGVFGFAEGVRVKL